MLKKQTSFTSQSLYKKVKPDLSKEAVSSVLKRIGVSIGIIYLKVKLLNVFPLSVIM